MFVSSCKGRSFGYFPHSSDCQRYHVCLPHRTGGYRHWNFRCGPGTVFSNKHQSCVHKDRVGDIC